MVKKEKKFGVVYGRLDEVYRRSMGNAVEQGILYIARLSSSSSSSGKGDSIVKSERRRNVQLTRAKHRFTYFPDSGFDEALGSINLRYASIEYGPEIGENAFVIRQVSGDKAWLCKDSRHPTNVSKWCATLGKQIKSIKEPQDYIVSAKDLWGMSTFNLQINVVGFEVDEVTHLVEFEVQCMATFSFQKDASR